MLISLNSFIFHTIFNVKLHTLTIFMIHLTLLGQKTEKARLIQRYANFTDKLYNENMKL